MTVLRYDITVRVLFVSFKIKCQNVSTMILILMKLLIIIVIFIT